MSSPTTRLDAWSGGHVDLVQRMIIPAGLKWTGWTKANITERVHFPGIDGLSRWLTRHYSPSGKPLELRPSLPPHPAKPF